MRTPEVNAREYNKTPHAKKAEVLGVILHAHYLKAVSTIKQRGFRDPADIIGVLEHINKKFKQFAKKTKDPDKVTPHGFEIMIFKQDKDMYKLWFEHNEKIKNKE